MWKKLFLILVVATSFSLHAQVANAGFENWDSTANYEEPVDWNSSNQVTAGIPGGIAIEKSNDSHSGNYAASVKTTFLGISAQPYSGILTNGTINQFGDTITGGEPISYLPDSIDFYFKYSPQNGSANQGVFLTLFFRNTNGDGQRDTVAVASKLLFATSNYTKARTQVLLVDTVNIQVDSFLIMFFSDSNAALNAGATLLVDDISFGDTLILSVKEADAISLTLYPNPVNDYFVIQSNDGQPIHSATLMTLDGRKVKYQEQIEAPDRMRINTDRLEKGIYVIQLEMEDGSSVRKMVNVVR
ncbi:MAG: T9SS type A sorting domain-containing protein [Chitinophagales bacterium]|nr:T9SS type A sorting domain-containing protein [Chitinophagales bacterium]